MTEIMIAGDWHGNHPWAKRVISLAETMNIGTVIQVGDFGIWPGQRGEEYLDILSRHLVKKDINLFFVPGNHEDWNQIDSWDPSKFNDDGHYEVKNNLFYAGKANVWEWENRRFASAGGAYSIDRRMRKPQVDWWPQEEFTNADLYKIKDFGKVDYLFTHDAPSSIPMRDLKPDVNSNMHREMMNRVGRILRPSVWFHGHYHRFTGEYGFMHSDGYASVYGLEADDQASFEFDREKLMRQHVLILNTKENEVRMLE